MSSRQSAQQPQWSQSKTPTMNQKIKVAFFRRIINTFLPKDAKRTTANQTNRPFTNNASQTRNTRQEYAPGLDTTYPSYSDDQQGNRHHHHHHHGAGVTEVSGHHHMGGYDSGAGHTASGHHGGS